MAWALKSEANGYYTRGHGVMHGVMHKFDSEPVRAASNYSSIGMRAPKD